MEVFSLAETAGNGNLTYGQMNLFNTLRKLWMELAMWRRAFLVSYAANFGDIELVGERLYQAPTNLGNILEVFFGFQIARRVENLIREQIITGLEILNAEGQGNREAVDAGTERLYRNADQIAAYLAEINPYWSEEEWKRLLYEYYETTIREMVMVLSGYYAEDIALYENLEDQALNIADYMARGIIEYFMG
jgi:hypothetical protein